MKINFKRNAQLSLSLLMAVTAQVSGMGYDSSECCEPVPCCVNESSSISIYGELLYWRPELCGLEGAFGNTTIATTVDSNAITTTTVIETDKEPDSKWDAGFRIGANAMMNNFDVVVEWTHFDGRAKFNQDTQFGHWKIKYDVIDLTFGHKFNLTSCFDIRPYIGVRGAHIHQKLTSHLETLFTSDLIGNNTVFTDKDDKEKFCGVGPQIGIDVNWHLGCNLSLYGRFAVASYYGHVTGRNFDVDTFTQTVSVCDGKRRGCFNNLATDAAIGIRWDSSSNICGCCMDFMLKLGLEQHRIYDFSELGSDGNLSLDGGVFAAGVGFTF